MSRTDDERWMHLALDLAAQGRGFVEPNPMVGCVIVRNGVEIGRGFHRKYGKKHAEIEALEACHSDPAGATMYVSLEPCCHHGKTPPCVDRVVEAGIGRVVVADQDPFHHVAGRGFQRLREANIDLEIGVCQQNARELNAPWLKRLSTGRPWVMAKWAMTLDGKIATRTGDSKWVSGATSRELVHQLRGRVDAIVVGSQTAVADDPLLTARPAGPRLATRIVVDSSLRISGSSRLVETACEVPTLLATSNEASSDKIERLNRQGCEILRLGGEDHMARLDQLLLELGRRDMTNLLVEGGGGLLGELFDMGQIDEVYVFIANKIVGGSQAVGPIAGRGIDQMCDSLNLFDLQHRLVGEDILVHGRIRR